jgi:cyanophycin synthetase
MVIDNKLVAAAKRVPAHVVGDGQLPSRITTTNKLRSKKRYGHEMY